MPFSGRRYYRDCSHGEVILSSQFDPIVDDVGYMSIEQQYNRALLAGYSSRVATGAYDSDMLELAKVKDIENPDRYSINPLTKPGADITEVTEWYQAVSSIHEQHIRDQQIRQQQSAIDNLPPEVAKELHARLLRNNPDFVSRSSNSTQPPPSGAGAASSQTDRSDQAQQPS